MIAAMTKPRSTHGTLTEHELGEFRTLIETRSGILFDRSRDRFFSTRVRELMEARGLAHGAELLRLVRGSNVEYDAMLERLLTQETSFLRYPGAFRALERKVLPQMHARKFWQNPRSLRIWSAGCASGEEPYSIALTIAETLEFADAWNIEILATDISKEALKHAEAGRYTRRSLGALEAGQVERHFLRRDGHYQVKPRLRGMVQFAPMNLAQSVYLGRFDCIFCMNVLIYFSESRRSALIQRFHDYLEPGGYLFLGHAESVARLPVKFESFVHDDFILYQKPATAAPQPAMAGQEKP